MAVVYSQDELDLLQLIAEAMMPGVAPVFHLEVFKRHAALRGKDFSEYDVAWASLLAKGYLSRVSLGVGELTALGRKYIRTNYPVSK